ncbi:NRDE family protein [Dasania marina]|uniref:NRDE family protein n=1 Tax=Dasania marina TaxID=471499 RepID=UPI0030DAE53E
MNRDEARSRVEDGAIEAASSAQLNSWYPVDKESGGTWVGVNNAGIVAMLLNRYQEQNPVASHSRGELVPAILATKNSKELTLLAAQLNWQNYAPCDVLVFDRHRWTHICWNGQGYNLLNHDYVTPLLRTSSSEDLDRTRQWRLHAFSRFLDLQSTGPEAVLNFHLSPCAHDPSIGVNMARPDRHTKSITQIQLSKGLVQARYFSQQALTAGPDTQQWDITWPIWHHWLRCYFTAAGRCG